MTDAVWQVEDVACGMCGERSAQTVAPDLTTEGSHDLEGRPAEPVRSALFFQLGRCPQCGYVGAAESLWAPDDRAEQAAVAGLVGSRAYRELSADPKLPIVARAYLCRAWIDDVLGDPARALMGALFAAWVCDDQGLDAAAGELRTQAIGYWDEARDTDRPAYADSPVGVSEAIRAEMLRRIGRFEESVEQAVAALALADVEAFVEEAISFIADRAARGDREAHSVERAFEEQAEESDPRLVSHGQGIGYRRRLIAGAIGGLFPRERCPGQLEDAIVFDGGGYYVQILVRPEQLSIYAEAVDLDAYDMGSLSDSQRELLERLGWARGREESASNYHRVFEASTGEALAAELAGELELTLRLVYGADEVSPLGVTVITYDKETKEELS